MHFSAYERISLYGKVRIRSRQYIEILLDGSIEILVQRLHFEQEIAHLHKLRSTGIVSKTIPDLMPNSFISVVILKEGKNTQDNLEKME